MVEVQWKYAAPLEREARRFSEADRIKDVRMSLASYQPFIEAAEMIDGQERYSLRIDHFTTGWNVKVNGRYIAE